MNAKKRIALIVSCIFAASVILCACTYRHQTDDVTVVMPDTLITENIASSHAYLTTALEDTVTIVTTDTDIPVVTDDESVTSERAVTEPTTTAPPVTTEPPVTGTFAPPDEPKPQRDYAAEAKADYQDILEASYAAVERARKHGSTVSYPFEPLDRRARLEAPGQLVYDKMYEALQNFEPLCFDEATEKYFKFDVISYTAEIFYANHPEYQYYSCIKETEENGRVVKAELCYFLPSDGTDVTHGDKSELIEEIAYFEAVCDYIVSTIPEHYSTYAKYMYLAAVISNTTNYDRSYRAVHNHSSAYAAIVGGLSICEGYAIGFEYLCRRADLWCARVEGANFARDTHMWNLIKLEGGTYHVDVTWSDTGGSFPCRDGWLRYFAKTQKEFLTDHIISDGTIATGT